MGARVPISLAVFLLACNLASTICAVGTSNVNIESRALVSFSDGNGAVEGAVVAGSAALAAGICVATAGVGCVVAAVGAVITSFLGAFALSGRELQDLPNTFLLLPPTPQKTHMERLMTELEPGTWHTVGHTHANGFNHTLHYFNGGSFSKLRAVQVPFITSTTPQKRQDEDDEDGTVAEYVWQNESEQSFDDFPASSDVINTLASDLADYMTSQNVAALCTDFTDADGVVASGILTLGANDQPFDFSTVGDEQSALASCSSDYGL